MAGRLQDTSFISLLPDSIAGDAAIRAAAASLDGVLRSLALSIPNLLIYSRLLLTAGRATSFRLLPALQRLIDARGGLKLLSTAELELLAWQFHVDFREVARSDADLAKMILESIPWHRIKGTPAGIKRALALFGYDVGIEEDGEGDRWACYQLDLKNVLALSDVQKVFAVAREMAPVRCRLWRVYNSELDIRPIRLSLGPGLSLGYLSAWSGIPVPDASDTGGSADDPLVSLGARLSLANGDHGHTAGLFLRSSLSATARRMRAFHLSLSPLSVLALPRRHGFMFAISLTLGESHAHKPIPARRYSFSKSQAVLSEAWAGLGRENCRLSLPVDRYLTNPFALSAASLSTHDAGLRCDPIHEIASAVLIGGCTVRARAAHGGCVATNIHMAADPRRDRDRTTWPDTAASRRWWPHVAFRNATGDHVDDPVRDVEPSDILKE